MEARDVLEHCRDSGEIVRVEREDIERGSIDGYVVACGPRWFALEVFDDGMRLNGFSCMRYEDVTSCKAAPNGSFKEKVLAIRKQARRVDSPIDVTSIENLIRSASSVHPLVSMHLVDEGAYCYVGKILAVSEENVHYINISPDAVWAAEPSLCALASIVRVDVGGAYEEALFLVGGRS